MIEYEKYRGLIVSRAVYWARVSHSDIQEMISEGNLCFAKSVESFDPLRGSKFSTYLYQALYNHFLTYFKSRNREETHTAEVPEDFDIPSFDNPEQSAIFRTSLNRLSPDAKTIVALVLDPPADFLEFAKPNSHKIRPSMWNLRRYLEAKGWRISRIRRSFSNIQEQLK